MSNIDLFSFTWQFQKSIQITKLLTELNEEINEVYIEIREKCPPFRFACILRTIVTLRKKQ